MDRTQPCILHPFTHMPSPPCNTVPTLYPYLIPTAKSHPPFIANYVSPGSAESVVKRMQINRPSLRQQKWAEIGEYSSSSRAQAVRMRSQDRGADHMSARTMASSLERRRVHMHAHPSYCAGECRLAWQAGGEPGDPGRRAPANVSDMARDARTHRRTSALRAAQRRPWLPDSETATLSLVQRRRAKHAADAPPHI